MFSKEADFENAEILYVDVSKHSTVCVISFINGFEVIGAYICRRDETNNSALRKERAYQNAVKQYERHANKQAK